MLWRPILIHAETIEFMFQDQSDYIAIPIKIFSVFAPRAKNLA